MPERVPSRALAAILAFALPPGVGQAYLGLTRRAVAWFVVFVVLLVAVPVALPALGAAMGERAAVAVYLVALAARWIAPVVDVLQVKRERFRPTRTGLVIAFACVGLVDVMALSFATRVSLIEAFKIPSGAMIPTLLVGDHIFVDKLVYRDRAPRYGEVMVFAFPEQPKQDFIK
ncbi:MAG: S26 family signal peptidase, partial [Polyangiaceae bacterium]